MPGNNQNCFFPSTLSTEATLAAPSILTSGIVIGLKKASSASNNAFEAINQNTAQRDSLLAALHAYSQKQEDEIQFQDLPGLNLLPDMKDLLAAESVNFLASVVSNIVAAPFTASTHASQLTLDLTATVQGIFSSVENPKNFTRPDASTLRIDQELQEKQSGFSAHCQALTRELGHVSDKLGIEIDNNIPKQGDFAESHACVAKTTAALPFLSTLGSSALLALGLDSVGSVLREMSASTHFSQQESAASEKEKNIYHAFSVCSASFSASKNCLESLKALRDLEKALSDFNEANNLCEAHSVISPDISVFIRSVTSGSFISTLRLLNSSAIALSAAYKALSKEQKLFYQNTKMSNSQASSIKEQSEGGKTHSQNVSELCKSFDQVIQDIDNDLQNIAHQNDQHQSDQSTIAGTAKSTARLSSALTLIPQLMIGFVGLISRECSGTIDFIRNDPGIKQECANVSASRKDQTGQDLDNLLKGVTQLRNCLERCEQLGVSAPVILGTSHMVASGALIATLNSMIGMCFALSELRTASERPSAALKLDEEEVKKAEQYKQSILASNQKTAKTLGTQLASENLSLHQHLQSVAEKIVLIHRSNQNFLQPGMERNDLNCTAKSTVAFTQGNSLGFLSGALGTLSLIALQSGMSTEAFLHTFSLTCGQSNRFSDGVDKTKTGEHSKSNLSFISNATRLTAEKSKDSSVFQSTLNSTHHISEVASSRSLTVALCHSGALTEALRRLIEEEKAQLAPLPGFSESALISGAIMDKLADTILAVLNDAKENHPQPIPGLNQDMASQLASLSKTSLVTALSSHSVFISSFLQSSLAAQAASQIEEEDKNEAVMDNSISKISSTGLNLIQAFTRNCIDQIKKLRHDLEEKLPANDHDQNDKADALQEGVIQAPARPIKPHHSSIQTHIYSNQTSAATLVSTCCLSLLCDEILEISLSRSLTLLNKDKVAETVKNSCAETKVQAKISSEKSSEDSNSGQSQSVTHILSALRLTLSRLGQSLAELADKLKEQSIDEGYNFQQNDLRMHTSQRSFIDCLGSSLSHCSVTLLKISGVLSMLPLTSADSVNDLRRIVHSLDHTLQFERVESCADSSRPQQYDDEDCSRSFIPTGMSTDITANIVLNIIKTLLRSSLLELDTSLSIAKILEIICLHQHPEKALSLEIQALSQPNGISKNTHLETQRASVSSCAVSAWALGISAPSKTDDIGSKSIDISITLLQRKIDEAIDACAMLADEEENTINNTIGLKSFYNILIRLLAAEHENREATDRDYSDLVNRLNRGGIALSNYHSEHGGLPENKPRIEIPNVLIKKNRFMKCDDASSLLETFIHLAAINEVKNLNLNPARNPNFYVNRGEENEAKNNNIEQAEGQHPFVNIAQINIVLAEEGQQSLLEKFKNQLIGPGKSLSSKTRNLWTYIVEKVADEAYRIENARFLKSGSSFRNLFDKKQFIERMSLGEQQQSMIYSNG